MDFPHIRYLCVVREVFRHGRIGVAADIVHLSQPAATQAVARLETTLGVPLFERRPAGMFATEAGEIFERRVERILEHLRRGDSLARKKAARRGGAERRHAFYKQCTPIQLRALVAVDRAGNFSQAAAALGVSQPGVHRATKDLAALAGFALFEQTRGGVVLTSAAEAFVHHVRLALAEFRQAVYEVNEYLGRSETRISIGALPLSRTAIVPQAMDAMLTEAGDRIQINCVEARYPTLLRDLRFGELDLLIGAMRDPKPAEDIVQEPLFEDTLVIVTGPDHPLQGRADVTLDMTLAYPWIAPPRETPSGSYLFDTLRIQDRPDTPVRIVSSSLVMMRALLARGDYISIISKRQIEVELALGLVAPLPLNLAQSERQIGLTFREGWRPTPLQKRFVTILKQACLASPEEDAS